MKKIKVWSSTNVVGRQKTVVQKHLDKALDGDWNALKQHIIIIIIIIMLTLWWRKTFLLNVSIIAVCSIKEIGLIEWCMGRTWC